MVNLIVLYPQPIDEALFNINYEKHIALLHDKTGLPLDSKPYTVTKFISTPEKESFFYLMFSMPFASQEALDAALATPEMQEVSADATRISSGGMPVILVGKPE